MSDYDPDKARKFASMLRDKVGSKEYYSAKETVDDVRYAIGAGETAAAGAKLVGKSLFNIGKFIAGDLLPSALDKGASNYHKREEQGSWEIDDGLDDDIRDIERLGADIDAEMERLDADIDAKIQSMNWE